MPVPHIFPTIGTNPTPYYVPSSDTPEVITTDQGYFYMQVYGVQAAFTGSWWIGAQNLTIMSQVNLHLGDCHELGDQDFRSILQYRPLDKNIAIQLGFSPILVDFVPAKMKKVSFSIDYLVDARNYLKDLAGLITDKDLLSTISLAPGAAMVAKTIGTLSEKIVSTFFPQQERKPILQFSGDFNLAEEGLKEGYHVILGSHSPENPLPTKEPRLEVVGGGGLLMNEQPVTQLSYVILKIGCTKSIRDRFTGRTPWRDKLQEVRRLASDYADDPFADPDAPKKKDFWEKQCLPLLREASAVLKADPNFLDSEVELIYRSAYRECLDLITTKAATRTTASGQPVSSWQPDALEDRRFLGIPEKEDMDARLSEYAEHLFQARKKFKEIGIK